MRHHFLAGIIHLKLVYNFQQAIDVCVGRKEREQMLELQFPSAIENKLSG